MDQQTWDTARFGSAPPQAPTRRAPLDERLSERVRALETLTRREREVLSHIALGKTDRQIADELYLARITVSNHVANILHKLDVPNRTAAAALAAGFGGGQPIPAYGDPAR